MAYNLQEQQKRDRLELADWLDDFFKEVSLHDPSVGIQGCSDYQAELMQEIVNKLKSA